MNVAHCKFPLHNQSGRTASASIPCFQLIYRCTYFTGCYCVTSSAFAPVNKDIKPCHLLLVYLLFASQTYPSPKYPVPDHSLKISSNTVSMQGQPVRRVDHALSVGRLALLPFEIRQHIFYLVLQEFFPEDTSMARWIIMPFSDAWNKSMLPSVDDLDVDLAVTAGTAEGFLPSIFELRAYYVDFR